MIEKNAAHHEPSLMLPPPEPDLPLIHHRRYDIRAYRASAEVVQLRGVITDDKPAGLHLAGDPEPLRIHHIAMDLFVELPTATISDVAVIFDLHPHLECPRISEHYRALVGLPVTRGFTNAVRELFGGPRGCTHTNALLNAMVPVVIQTSWSMRVLDAQEEPVAFLSGGRDDDSPAREWTANIGTCHVWADDGDLVGRLRDGEELHAPLPFVRRAEERGVTLTDWSWQRGDAGDAAGIA